MEVLKTRNDIDLVLADVRMPILGGLELFRAIRELGRDVPVIMMTACAQESILKDAINEGVFAILNKPFDPDSAVSVLRRASDRPRVLIVDDMQRDADTLVAALDQCGIRAVAAYSGKGSHRRPRRGRHRRRPHRCEDAGDGGRSIDPSIHRSIELCSQ